LCSCVLGEIPSISSFVAFFVFVFFLSSFLLLFPVDDHVIFHQFATTIPKEFTSITEITSLSLTNSNLTALPESLGLLSLLSFPLFPFLIILPCLASFTGLVELDLSHNPLGDSAVPFLVSIIKASHTLKTLPASSFRSLNDLKLTPAGMFQAIQALVFNFTEGNLVLQSLE